MDIGIRREDTGRKKPSRCWRGILEGASLLGLLVSRSEGKQLKPPNLLYFVMIILATPEVMLAQLPWNGSDPL